MKRTAVYRSTVSENIETGVKYINNNYFYA